MPLFQDKRNRDLIDQVNHLGEGNGLGAEDEMEMEGGDREERQEMVERGDNNEMEGRSPQQPQQPQRQQRRRAERPPPPPRPPSTRVKKNKHVTYMESTVKVHCGPGKKKRKAKKKEVEEKRNVSPVESESSNFLFNDRDEIGSGDVKDDMQTDGEETERVDFNFKEGDERDESFETKEGDDKNESIQTTGTERVRIDGEIEPIIKKLRDFLNIEDAEEEEAFMKTPSEDLFKKKGRKWRIPKGKRLIALLKKL